MIADSQCIEAYKKHQHLFSAAEELGIPWQTLYSRLKKAGHPVTGNKSKWGSVKDRFAAKGEECFLSFVPTAQDNNKAEFQSKVDFVVNGYNVDIKSAKRKKSHGGFKSERWAFSLKKQIECADFYILFGFDEYGKAIECCYLLPRDMIIGLQTISIPCSSKSKWNCFRVEPESLSDFFDSLGNKT